MKNAEKEALRSIDPDLKQVNYLRKKRHLLVDNSGLLLIAMVRSAGIQHRDGGLLLATLCGIFPMLATMFADSAYGITIFSAGLTKLLPQLNVNIIRRSNNSGFCALLKRWIVGRTIAWLNRCRRLAKDWKILILDRISIGSNHPLDVMPGQARHELGVFGYDRNWV